MQFIGIRSHQLTLIPVSYIRHLTGECSQCGCNIEVVRKVSHFAPLEGKRLEEEVQNRNCVSTELF